MHLTIGAICKNEAKYLVEWMAYHFAIGVDKIIIFNNESDDQTSHIIEQAASAFPIIYRNWPTVHGISPQLSAYNEMLRMSRGNTDFLGLIDIDEFVVLTSSKTLVQCIECALVRQPSAGAICINQRVFGDSSRPTYSNEPVLSRFTLCSRPEYLENSWVKSFYQPNAIEEITDVHSSKLMFGKHIHPSGEVVLFQDGKTSQTKIIDYSSVQLNHYITKSKQEFVWKMQRGGAAADSLEARLSRYSDEFFTGRQPFLNQIIEPSTAKIAARIEAILHDFQSRAKLSDYTIGI